MRTPDTLPAQPLARRRASARDRGMPPRRRAARKRERTPREGLALGHYTDDGGRLRELVARRGAGQSTLVIDRERASQADPRLVAHLAPDEPAGNAALVCRRYLQDRTAGVANCRLVTAADFRAAPLPALPEPDGQALTDASDARTTGRDGCCYRLVPLCSRMSIPELRWCRRAHAFAGAGEAVSMREAIGSLESYEPVRALTLRALACYGRDDQLSTAVLRAELVRVQASPIVLNRALRQAVLRALERGELSMSEIAIRCGRVKRDRRGNEAGETSWLARRIGLLPEGGQSATTPWIHSDVLALIARRGLGISPREVEL